MSTRCVKLAAVFALALCVLVGIPRAGSAQGTISSCFDCAKKQIAPLILMAKCCKPQWLDHPDNDCDQLAQDWWYVNDRNIDPCRETKIGQLIPGLEGGIGESWECLGQECTDQDPRELDPGTSPIVIRLGPGMPRLSSAAEGIVFPSAATSELVRIAWPIDEETAFLALDRDGNGTIDYLGEMFGNFTPLRSGILANHGYEALAEMDENGDGRIDDQDPAFAGLRLWLDVDRDGYSSPGELHPLPEVGVTGLSTAWSPSRRRDRHGNEFRYRARVAGTVRGLIWSWDVFLTTVPVAGVDRLPRRCDSPQAAVTGGRATLARTNR